MSAERLLIAERTGTLARILNENVDRLTKYDDMLKAYDELNNEEVHVNKDLEVLLQRQAALDQKMQSLQSTLPNLQMVQNDSKQLDGMISFTSTLAETVSSKVRQLDLAKSHVVHCIEIVEDVLDLKFCTDGVQTALQDEDYEKAAAHIHRFLALDENVLRLGADANEGSTLDTSFKLLHEAQTKLKAIIHNKFDTAVRCGDVASVERFFKTFPLIGDKEAGLVKFSKYLCSQLNDTSTKNLRNALAKSPDDKRANVIYADTMTLLFEEIARIVDIHQPLLETYYGHGRMLTMLEFIQAECDRQVRSILEHFKRNRDFDRKIHLVQQSITYQKSALERVDPKDIDPLLTEITLLNTRAELYTRFLRRRIYNDIEVAIQDEELQNKSKKDVDRFLNTSELSCQMQEFIGSYILMEEYFMRQMVIKAVNMDQLDEGSLTSSMVDDAFFVVKKCVRRALSSSSVDGVCAMLNHSCTILEQDFREILFSKLRPGFSSGFDLTQAYNLVQSSITQGRLQSADVETEKSKAAFLTTLNNAEVSCEHIQTLKSNIQDDIEKLYSLVPDQAKAKLQSCLTDLGAVSTRFKDVLDFGFSQLVTGLIKPRMKPLMDTFIAVSHNISESVTALLNFDTSGITLKHDALGVSIEECSSQLQSLIRSHLIRRGCQEYDDFSNFEANDPWVQNLIFNLDGLLASFKNTLTSCNYDTLVSHLCNEITAQLEKVVMKTTFNRLGGLQFDKELRALVGYLTSITTWTIRDKFARLTQMATILNLERVTEILDYWGSNSGPLTWRLTPAEVRQVLMLRTDFRSDDIKRLKL